MSSSPTAAVAAAAAAAAAAAGVTAAKICLNTKCKEPLLDSAPARRKGWRLRSGEIADLCDRCSCSFEQGNFCETYHSDDAGWRNCETCAKRVHCGCIVSAPTYIFLDAGGVDCVACAKKSVITAPNHLSPLLMPQQASDRREFPSKSWKPMNGPFFGQWRQAPHIRNMTSAQSDLQQRLSFEFDRPNCIEKLTPGGRYSIAGHDKKYVNVSERTNTNNNNISKEKLANGKSGLDATSTFSSFRGEEGNAKGTLESCRLEENESASARKAANSEPYSTNSSGANLDAHLHSHVSSFPSTSSREDSSSLLVGMASFQSASGSKEPTRFSSNQSPCQAGPQPSKPFYHQGIMEADLQSQIRNGKSRVDNRVRAHLLPRYWPRITDQELQQISGDSNSVITPLFEKMLSASDAGRIGRLVLPKKCAEAYFPAISQPEGLPLKVQDANGKDWTFQFRFWPNNNSRMYVLEGVTPCIQSMQLQAGDTVTFSRIDPEGKLIMGFRKASGVTTEPDLQTLKSGNGFSPPQESSKGTSKDFKCNVESRNLINSTEQLNFSKFANEGHAQKDGLSLRSSLSTSRRKGGNLGLKSKRLRMENEDSVELKLTWEEAQQLLIPPPNCVPNIVVIEGHEFEEYEEAPVLGNPTVFSTNQIGSSCSAAQEKRMEQLSELIPCKAGKCKKSKFKVETDMEVSDGLDTLANLAILGASENLPSSQPTTKHPRHRPGCTCIVCIQPPSGKGPKHKQTCTCNVCLTVKRRFRTLMLRREKRQSEKEAETTKQQMEQSNPSPEKSLVESGTIVTSFCVSSSPKKELVNDEGISDEAFELRRASPSPLKAHQIDLNIQPEREEETSPKSETISVMRILQDTAT